MPPERAPKVAIVDFGLGNLYSVARACAQAGLAAEITSARAEVLGAEAVILPGVGAFGDAMANLRALDLVGPLTEAAASGKPLLGICLGMQLLLSESQEFGHHQGLGLIEGQVLRLENSGPGAETVKVPQVGWNRLERTRSWQGSWLEGLAENEFMYFVHSFYCAPADPEVVLAQASYGPNRFCAALKKGNVQACQFHPERSGPAGLGMYANLARQLAPRE